MPEGTPLKRGDACPNCGGELKAARVPSEEQRRRAEDREFRDPLPPDMDNASEAQRRSLGELFRCQTCGYATRFAAESRDDREPQTSARAGAGGSGSADSEAATAEGASSAASSGTRRPGAGTSGSRRES
jgi:predicted RNA-binding Zn-ribbon protein involved in translation (DUF1610 family)